MSTTITFEPVEATVEEIPTAYGPRIEKKLKALTKRLAKMGVPAPTVEYGPVVNVEYPLDERGEVIYDGSPKPTFPAFETVTVKGFEAKADGWTGIAVLDWTVSPDEAFVARFPGHTETEEAPAPEISDELRTRGPLCDHCRKVRSRNATIVFEHDDGRTIAVGTGCVLEYLGVDPRTILMLSDFVKSVSDDDFDLVKPSLNPFDFVALAAEVTRIDGFRKSAEPGSTKDLVAMLGITGPRTKADKEIAREIGADLDIERGRAKATAIAEWLDTDDSGSDFLRTAKVALNGNPVEPGARHAGILAALPFSHDRHIGLVAEREAKRKAEAEARKSGGFVGSVGDKVTVTGEVVFFNTYNGTYGTSARLTVLTTDGDRVTTYGSGNTLFGWSVGDKVEFTGKVKGHDDDPKWGKSTSFERVKVTELDENGDKIPECGYPRCTRSAPKTCSVCEKRACSNGHGRHYHEAFYCESCLDEVWEREHAREKLVRTMVRAANSMLGVKPTWHSLHSVHKADIDKTLEGAGVAA
jgi:hypothetical protein